MIEDTPCYEICIDDKKKERNLYYSKSLIFIYILIILDNSVVFI